MIDWHPLLQLLVVALAVNRVTVAVTDDAIFDVPRGELLVRLSREEVAPDVGTWRWYVAYLLTCRICLSLWVALVWSGAWALWPVGATIVATPFAVATAATWFGLPWDGEEDE